MRKYNSLNENPRLKLRPTANLPVQFRMPGKGTPARDRSGKPPMACGVHARIGGLAVDSPVARLAPGRQNKHLGSISNLSIDFGCSKSILYLCSPFINNC
jgi:hypothetical protein